MAARMWSARTTSDQEIFAEQESLALRVRPFVCKHCRAAVSYVPPHVREFRGKTYRVRGYFRLLSKAKHEKTCAFVISERIAVIAARSKGLIEMLRGEEFCFRLLAINDSRGEAPAPLSTPVTEPFDANSRRGLLFPSDANRLLPACLNTARRVIKLRSICGDNHTLIGRLRLVFCGASVDWRNFYYDESRHLAAFRRIQKASLSFPIALVGRVSRLREVQQYRRTLYVLELKPGEATPYSNDVRIGERAIPAVWTDHSDWIMSYRPDDEVLIFGHWKHASRNTEVSIPGNDSTAFRKHLERRMTIWLQFGSQIAKVR